MLLLNQEKGNTLKQRELDKMKKIELINLEGCLMDTTEETSFAKARKYFASKWSGSYKIRIVSDSGDKFKNVRL